MPDLWYNVDVALSKVPVNILPLLDDTDFKTIETAVAYNAAGLTLYWNRWQTGGTASQTAVTPTTSGNYDWGTAGGGMYYIEMPASGGASINNDTESIGWFSGVATGVLPWRGPTIGFRAEALNDALINVGTTGILAPTTNGRRLDVSAAGNAGIDWSNVEAPTTTLNLSGTSTLALEPTTAGRKLDVTTGGEAGIDWANIGSPTTAQNLSATNIDVDQVVASVSGAVGSVTGAVGSVTGNVGGNVTGSVGSVVGAVGSVTGNVGGSTASVVGAVGSVTGNVGGNVVGTVASVVGAVGSVTGNVGGNVTGTIGGLTTGALADFFDTNSGKVFGDAVAGSVVKEIADNAAISGTIDANLVEIGGDAQSATDLKDFADAGYDPSTNKVQGLVLADAVTVVNGLAANTVTATAIAADAITAAKIANGAIDAATFAAGAIDAAALATDAVNEIRDSVFARAFAAAYGSFTFAQLVEVIVASQAGKTSGAGTGTFTIRNLDDSADVIVASTTTGNRTAVTITP